MKTEKLFLYGALGIVAYYLLFKNNGVGLPLSSGGGGGLNSTSAEQQAYGSQVPAPATNFGETQTTAYKPPTAIPTLASQLSSAGATAAAVTTQTVGAGAMLAGSNYTVTSAGGVIKTLANYGGYESISPSGMGYSTASPTAAISIASGGSANPAYKAPTATVTKGLLSGTTSKYFK